MKKLFFIIIILACTGVGATLLQEKTIKDNIKVVLENDQLKVTEYESTPGKDVCGIGNHSHKAHLTVLITDMKAKATTTDGKTQEVDLPAGTTFWSEAETHSAINIGNKPVKVLLIEPK